MSTTLLQQLSSALTAAGATLADRTEGDALVLREVTGAIHIDLPMTAVVSVEPHGEALRVSVVGEVHVDGKVDADEAEGFLDDAWNELAEELAELGFAAEDHPTFLEPAPDSVAHRVQPFAREVEDVEAAAAAIVALAEVEMPLYVELA